MNDSALALAALEPLPSEDWLSECRTATASLRLSSRASRGELLIWRETRQHRSVSYADGWAIRRLWLGPARWALGLTERRLYFVGSTPDLDRRPERQIVSQHRPPALRADDAIARQWETINELRSAMPHATNIVRLRTVSSDLGKHQLLQIAEASIEAPPANLDSVYRVHGFDRVPEGFTITVCGLEGAPTPHLMNLARRLVDVGRSRSVRVAVRVSTKSAVRDRAGKDKATVGGPTPRECLLLVLPDENSDPHAETLEFLDYLETKRTLFRRAYATDPIEFSVPTQFSSLLAAAGGAPHRSRTQHEGRPVWSVAVDLSTRSDPPSSVLAMTLVDPDGQLVGAWTRSQRRDETPDVVGLRLMLDRCRQQLLGMDKRPAVLLLRDGRLFERENVAAFRSAFPADMTLVEYRKGGNPQIAVTGGRPRPVRTPLAAAVFDTPTLFIITTPPRSDAALPGVVKLVCDPTTNGLALSPADIAQLVAASATAPGLGAQRHHLPSAIYWADGIAGASNSDLRFRGLAVDRL